MEDSTHLSQLHRKIKSNETKTKIEKEEEEKVANRQKSAGCRLPIVLLN